MLELLQDWLLSHGISDSLGFYTARLIAVSVVIVLAVTANFIVKRYILAALNHIISKTRSNLDDNVLINYVLLSIETNLK